MNPQLGLQEPLPYVQRQVRMAAPQIERSISAEMRRPVCTITCTASSWPHGSTSGCSHDVPVPAGHLNVPVAAHNSSPHVRTNGCSHFIYVCTERVPAGAQLNFPLQYCVVAQTNTFQLERISLSNHAVLKWKIQLGSSWNAFSTYVYEM